MLTDVLIEAVLTAASKCKDCRDMGKPSYENTMEHGEQYFHQIGGGKIRECAASQIWEMVDRIARKQGMK